MISLKNTEQASAVYALIFAALFAFLSFYGTDAETYLFPRIIAITLAIFSVILLVANTGSKDPATDSVTAAINFSDIWPGLLIGLVFFLMLETVGFYTSSFLAFLSILLVYGKRRASNPRALIFKITISLAFMIILYLLFWKGLHVRTPTGWLF
jgi:hypothetical protein